MFLLSGWFEVLPENGQPIEYFDTINAIVGIRPKQFLVRTSIVGYQLTVENGISSWVPWEIRPGEVLTTGIVQMDQKKTKKKPFFKRLFSSGKANSKKEQELKYLQCFDVENREIMIPLIMTGVFSPVGDATSTNFDAVYSLRDLISAFPLPIKAQLIHTDSNLYEGIPSGVLTLNNLKDKETLLVTTLTDTDGNSETFELPVKDEINIIREKKKSEGKHHSNGMGDYDYEDDNMVFRHQVDLPVRVKDSKRNKGSAIFEKLSVRSKNRKERASLKALQEAGVFSSRLSKTEITYGDYDNVDSNESQTEDVDDSDNKISPMPLQNDDMNVNRQSKESDAMPAYSKVVKRNSLKDRDLPPIPGKTRSPRRNRQSDNKENHYEELPIAPRPPRGVSDTDKLNDSQNHENDGYMTPARLSQLNDENEGIDFEVVKRKPPTAPRDSLRYTRVRKVRSEFSPLTSAESENIDNMFDFSGAEQEPPEGFYDRRRPPPGYSTPVRRVPQEDVNFNFRQRLYSDDDQRRFHDDTVLEPKSLSGFSKIKSRSHKSLAETNATIRSHNVRKMRTAMEVFNFSDSLRDLRQPFQNNDQVLEPTYGRVIDNERVKSYIYGARASGPVPYSESEPPYRKYQRTPSTTALSDSYPKHGDDSAISMCSRGEYGFNGESEYSYSEYSEWQDDGWQPPQDIGNLSVLEVSKSLRYIGMKDRVVIRFAHEQIDGDMLCSLDKKLLQEGFPELNALEIKKILDFVRGWRPKK